MSFFGKNFKKTKFENIDELLDANKAPEEIRSLITNVDGITRYEKNADGSIQYIVTRNGEEKMNMKMTLNTEVDFVTPNGIKTKVTTKLDGNKIETVMAFPDGTKLNMHRTFENNAGKLVLWKDDNNVKGTLYYEQV